MGKVGFAIVRGWYDSLKGVFCQSAEVDISVCIGLSRPPFTHYRQDEGEYTRPFHDTVD